MEAILGPALTDHFKEYYRYYVFCIICVIPIIFVTRKWSVSFLLYNIEIFVYLCLMHVAVWVLVVLTVWFKDQSSMKRAYSVTEAAPDWGTPIIRFWEKDAYSPNWLFWLEVVLACMVFFLVWKYRPMRMKRARKFKYDPKKKSEMATKYGTRKYAPGGGRGGRK